MSTSLSIDRVQAQIDGLRDLVSGHPAIQVRARRELQSHLLALEIAISEERERAASMSLPATPGQRHLIEILAERLRMRIVVPPKMSQGQAVEAIGRLSVLATTPRHGLLRILGR